MKHIVRIELLAASDPDREALSRALRLAGFEHTVAGRDGQRFVLPAGEYTFDGKATVYDVLDLAKRAAASTGKECRVLATEVAGQVWFGLEAHTPT